MAARSAGQRRHVTGDGVPDPVRRLLPLHPGNGRRCSALARHKIHSLVRTGNILIESYMKIHPVVALRATGLFHAPFGWFDPARRRPDLTAGAAFPMFRPKLAADSAPKSASDLAANPLEFHEYRRGRIARQGEDDQQISGPRLRGSGLLWPYPRPAGQGRFGRPRRQFPHALGGRRQVEPAHQRHRPGAQGRRQADPGHRPRPRGRGDLLARAGGAQGEEGAQGPDGRARGVQRHHQAGRDSTR